MLKSVSIAALLLATGVFAAPASAGPAAGLAGVKDGATTTVDKVANRRCWRSGGQRHCRTVRTYRRSPSYAYDDDGYGRSYGYGPSVNFSIGRDRGRHYRDW